MTSAMTMTMTKTHTKTKTKTKTKVVKRPNMCYIFEKGYDSRISNMMMVGELVMMHWG